MLSLKRKHIFLIVHPHNTRRMKTYCELSAVWPWLVASDILHFSVCGEGCVSVSICPCACVQVAIRGQRCLPWLFSTYLFIYFEAVSFTLIEYAFFFFFVTKIFFLKKKFFCPGDSSLCQVDKTNWETRWTRNSVSDRLDHCWPQGALDWTIAGQWPIGINLSQLPQCWGYKYAPRFFF